KLAYEFPHRAVLPELAVSSHVSGEITLQPRLTVPMRRSRIARIPFFPSRIGRGDIDEDLAVERSPQSQMWVEPSIRLRERLELVGAPLPIPFRRPFDRDLGADRD